MGDVEHLKAGARHIVDTSEISFLMYKWMTLKDVFAEFSYHTEPIF